MAESIYKFLMQDALSTGGGQDDALKDKKGDMEKEDNRRTNKKSLQQQIGIQLTLAGILKQSSIFTGFIGSLFQIVGAFVDTLLMGAFPLLKGGLKFIIKLFEPIKAIGAGISTIVEFVIKIFSSIANALPSVPGGGDVMDLPGQIGNPLSILKNTKGFTGKLKGIPYVGQILSALDIVGALGAPEDIDKLVGVVQSLTSLFIRANIAGLAAAAAPFTLGGSAAAGATALGIYEFTLAPQVDAAIKESLYGMFNARALEDSAYSTAPMD